MLGSLLLNAHVLAAAETQPAVPAIRGILPATGLKGSSIIITGDKFGTNANAITVLFGSVPAKVNAVTDDRIETMVPNDLPSGGVPVVVTVAGNPSTPFIFEVTTSDPGGLGLAIRPSGNGELLVSWPSRLTNAVLQRALTLLSPWITNDVTPARGPFEFFVRVTNAPTVSSFYRLTSPGSTVPEQLVLNDDWKPVFPVTDSITVTVTPTAKSTLKLNNGAMLEVPAGAVSSITEISFRKLDLSVYSAGISREVYQVQPDNLSLKVPVQVTLPYRKAAGASSADVHVFRTGASDGTTELPATINEAQSTVRVATEHFSNLVVEDDRSYLDTFSAARNSNESVVLPVPYYSQAESLWCFAAAMQMMLKHYGRDDAEIWDIARYFNVGLTQGAKQWRLWAGHYSDLFRAYNLEVLETCGWVLPLRVHGYIIQQLKAGRPVMVIVEASHAVVAVGYDAAGVFIHDPSGEAIKGITGQSADKSQLATRHFTWDEWTRALFLNIDYVTFPLPVWTIVLKGTPAPPNPSGTITLNTGVFTTVNGKEEVGDGDLAIDRGYPKEAHLTWDGRLPLGYWLAAKKGFFPTTVANSDTMLLKIHTHNAGSTPFNAAFRVELEGKTIGTAQQTIPARSTSTVVPIFEWQAPYSFLTGAAGLLFPGSHTVKIEMSANNRILDTIDVLLEIGPAKPAGVKRTPISNGNKITWDANPEERFTSLEYVVHGDGIPLGVTSAHEFVHLTTKTDIEYRVFAQHAATRLNGPLSEPATLAVTRPSYVRDTTPTVTIARLGGSSGLSLTNLTVTETGASIRGVNDVIWKISWNPPPAQVFDDDTIRTILTPDTGESPGQMKLHYAAKPPVLRSMRGDFGKTPSFNTSAMIRYDLQRGCDGDFNCYNLLTRSLTNNAWVDFDFTGFSIIVYGDGAWGDEYGTVGASIYWRYQRAP